MKKGIRLEYTNDVHVRVYKVEVYTLAPSDITRAQPPPRVLTNANSPGNSKLRVLTAVARPALEPPSPPDRVGLVTRSGYLPKVSVHNQSNLPCKQTLATTESHPTNCWPSLAMLCIGDLSSVRLAWARGCSPVLILRRAIRKTIVARTRRLCVGHMAPSRLKLCQQSLD
ncbi:hypothetical protein AG1IA_08207 [Rhizoctonia solani AG-1 IA]|uniref:Uncharacterized protein n=1 Tax=Thanatephorus cucumeris (strain AG1-IA) TaxID=983506 RepID=L8WN25_THACA|nr:hypothetical protein AG1IA_08207 [Rhizoctonia solani AG-1 IA]